MSARSDLTGIKITRSLSDRRITADYIVDSIREGINGGVLADGAVLNQADLATFFGVSRVPVREALRQLQAEGLIDMRAHHLAVVKGLDLDRLMEVYTLRSVIEAWLIEQATPFITEKLLAKVRAINEAMRTEQDHSRWLALNAQFHRSLYDPADRPATLELLEQLRLQGERYARMWSHGTGIHRPAETCAEHDRILDLVAAGDATGAAAAIREHVEHTRDRVVEFGATLAVNEPA